MKSRLSMIIAVLLWAWAGHEGFPDGVFHGLGAAFWTWDWWFQNAKEIREDEERKKDQEHQIEARP